ncbi:MAG: hypothetical protein RIS47_550 [Bacteroidota bacterium]|jgi:chemotaxis protein methyltransferase CheR
MINMPPMNLSDAEINEFIVKIAQITGNDFSEYSEKSFRRRIEKILSDRQIDIAKLSKSCESSSQYMHQVIRDITVNTTELFRDHGIWDELYQYLDMNLRGRDSINVWSAGCSNGLELYSTMILFNELGLLEKSNFYGTDLNSDMLAKAREAKYTYRKEEDFFDNFRKIWKLQGKDVNVAEYFELNPREYSAKIVAPFPTMPILKQHNLTQLEPAFDVQFDVIFCRNVLIYFNHDLQDRIFYYFHNLLRRRGILVLGIHEGMLGSISERYLKHGHIYIKH